MGGGLLGLLRLTGKRRLPFGSPPLLVLELSRVVLVHRRSVPLVCPLTVRGYDRSTLPNNERSCAMDDGKLDDAKGRVKQAAGDLTDDDSLKNEGRVDRATGTVKDKVGDADDKDKEVVKPDD